MKDFLKALRNNLSLSQDNLAVLLQRSRAIIAQMEIGKRKFLYVPTDRINKIEAATAATLLPEKIIGPLSPADREMLTADLRVRKLRKDKLELSLEVLKKEIPKAQLLQQVIATLLAQVENTDTIEEMELQLLARKTSQKQDKYQQDWLEGHVELSALTAAIDTIEAFLVM